MSLPINRAPFTALVDDDGSNTTGTPWNKQAIKDVLLDPGDTAARLWTNVELTIPGGDYPDWNPGIVGDTVVTITSVAAGATLTVYGFKPAAPAYVGQRVVLHMVNDASTFLSLYHEYNGSSPGCMLRCRKAPVVTVSGFWCFVEFQYAIFGGVGAWVMGGYGNGIGAP